MKLLQPIRIMLKRRFVLFRLPTSRFSGVIVFEQGTVKGHEITLKSQFIEADLSSNRTPAAVIFEYIPCSTSVWNCYAINFRRDVLWQLQANT